MSESESKNSAGKLEPLAVPPKVACEIGGFGNTTCWALIKSGKLRATKVGRLTLIDYRSLKALVAPRAD